MMVLKQRIKKYKDPGMRGDGRWLCMFYIFLVLRDH